MNLTHAAFIRGRDPAAPLRRSWAAAAREILEEEGDAIALRPLEERLALAAAGYDFWLRPLGYPKVEPNRQEELHAQMRQLDAKALAALRDDLRLHALALRHVQVPSGYYCFINQVHEKAWAEFSRSASARKFLPLWVAASKDFCNPETSTIRKQWIEELPNGEPLLSRQARQDLDKAGITQARVIQLMNEAATATNKAFAALLKEKGIDRSALVLTVRGFDWDRASGAERGDEHSVWRDAHGGYYYRVGSRSTATMDARQSVHMAFHEPQHPFQQQLQELRQEGVPLPSPLDEAARIFAMRDAYGVMNCPPTVFFVDDMLRKLAGEIYHNDPKEVTALYQGWLAELAVTHESGLHVRRPTRDRIDQKPHLVAAMPKAIRNGYAPGHP